MSETIHLGDGDTAVSAYLSEPRGTPRGALIVVHEVWGLVPHTKDVADRFAAEGYVALAPDLFSVAGLTADVSGELQRAMFNPDERIRTEAQPRLRAQMSPTRSPEFAAGALARVRECFDYLAAREDVGGRVGIVGFCFGGTQAFALAVAEPRVRAAVPPPGYQCRSTKSIDGPATESTTWFHVPASPAATCSPWSGCCARCLADERRAAAHLRRRGASFGIRAFQPS